MSSKVCFKCAATLPLSAFYKHPTMSDGHLNKCIECTKSDVARHREKNIDRIREYDKERSKDQKRLDLNKRVTSRWRKNNPERYKAHLALNNAVRDGRVKREPCVVCGDKAHAHHDDYSRPLDVVWLCAVHHKAVHNGKMEVGDAVQEVPA